MNNPAPHTLADWLIFRATHRDQLSELDLTTLAVIYGLSSRAPYNDPALCYQIEHLVEHSPDPLHTGFMLAYHAATYYEDISSSWGWGKISAGASEDQYGAIPTGQPGYIAGHPPSFIQQIKHWLIAGIEAYRDDRGRMQLIHWIKYRSLAGDSFLLESDIAELESALGYEIVAAADSHAKELARQVLENFERLNKGKKDLNLE
jgi:hypothetical protein